MKNSFKRRNPKFINLSKIKNERKKKHNQTQKINRKQKINEKRNIDIDEITDKLEKINLGKNIEILAAIWSHGGQCVIGIDKEPFFVVKPNVQTNILGLGYSGVCSISNSKTNTEIDNNLRVNPNENTTTNLTEKLLFNTKEFIKQTGTNKKSLYDPFVINDNEEKIEDYYSLVKNYDSKRCNKLYAGYKPGDPLYLPGQIKNGKILLRLYAMNTTGLKYSGSSKFPHDIYLDDNTSLNDIIDTIISFVYEHSKFVDNEEKLIINLFDSTCNYTADETIPNLAFTDTKTQRQNKTVKRTNIMQERIKDLTLNLDKWGIRSKSKKSIEISPKKTSSHSHRKNSKTSSRIS
jgi:hypothetical protein